MTKRNHNFTQGILCGICSRAERARKAWKRPYLAGMMLRERLLWKILSWPLPYVRTSYGCWIGLIDTLSRNSHLFMQISSYFSFVGFFYVEGLMYF